MYLKMNFDYCIAISQMPVGAYEINSELYK